MTVFIPTFNGERYLDRVLCSLESQQTTEAYEILVIDSGSQDETLEIISQHPAVRLVQIPQSDFGHGKTRNFAAQLARGEYIIFLSHDAVPIGETFLTNMVQPLKPVGAGGYGVHGVVGKHVARTNCTPSLKYGIQSVFKQCGPDGELTIVDGAVTGIKDLPRTQLFYSDVCSATRRDFLLETLPYQDLPYAEDMAFGKDLISLGFKKAYQPAAVVEHSNDVTLREYPKRTFDETLGMRRINPVVKKFTKLDAFVRWGKETLISTSKIVVDSDYSWWKKPYWMVKDSFFIAGKWVGVYRGLTVDLNDRESISRFSLEAERA